MTPARMVGAVVALSLLGGLLAQAAWGQALDPSKYAPSGGTVMSAWDQLLVVPGLLVGLLIGAGAMFLANGGTSKRLDIMERDLDRVKEDLKIITHAQADMTDKVMDIWRRGREVPDEVASVVSRLDKLTAAVSDLSSRVHDERGRV